jgi:signal transduction histidine kinase
MEKVGWTFFVHPDDLPNAARVWQKALETGGAYEVEFRIKRASDGSYRWHLVRAFPMSNEQGAVIQWVGTCTDIDDQRQLSEQLGETAAKLKDANEQLGDRAAHLEALVQQRTHRLSETVGELEAFSYSISHDMRSPLRSMIGFADVLKEDYANKLDATGLDYLNRISNASRRMDRLIQDVLSFSRIGSQNIALGPVDADALIRDVIGSYPNLQSERVQITFISRLPSVQANEALLTQCFSNLMENAAKFVTPGNKAQIEVWSETSGTRTRLYFKDHGIGIPDHSIARIFDIFHRVGRDTDGTGIGLAIVRKAVEKMGGKVGVESELGQGSLFWLDLELASESLAPA